MKNTWGKIKVLPDKVPDNGIMLTFSSESPILNGYFPVFWLWSMVKGWLWSNVIKITGNHGMLQSYLNTSA